MTEGKEVAVNKKLVSKIEGAGKNVMSHLIELAKSTELSYDAMAQKMNEMYGTKLNKMDVCRFFKKNTKTLAENFIDESSLSEIRAKLFLDANKELVKDIKKFDSEIERLTGEEGELLEIDKRAKAVGDLLDKKGRLLLRHARLSGKLNDRTRSSGGVENMQVNIYQADEQKSDIIEALKTVEFQKEKAIEVKADEIKKTDSN